MSQPTTSMPIKGSLLGSRTVQRQDNKNSCVVAAPGNVVIATLGDGDTVDGVVVNQGERVLLPNQTDLKEVGSYDVGPAGGPSVRSADFDEDSEVTNGVNVIVVGGATGAGTWVVTTADPIIVGTTLIVMTQNPPAPHVHTHASTTGQTIDDHHPKLHAADHISGPDQIAEFIGANGGNGTKGLVKTPVVADLGKFLAADGTWKTVAHSGLSGISTDDHHAELHASSHQHNGGDEIATVTPGANAIPKATGAGVLSDGWISQSAVTQHEAAIDHDALLNYVLAQHRIINDAGSSTNELLSASKILALTAAAANGLDLKDSVETVANSDITLSGEQTLNSVTTSASRVGVVGQTNKTENGIYISAAGAWSRSPDADEDAEITQGLTFFVADGDKKGFQYIITTADPIVVDTTLIDFAEVPRIELGTTAGTAAEGNDPRILTQDENDAAQGTSGTPSGTNRFVTAAAIGTDIIAVPASLPVTDDALVRWNGATGGLAQNSLAILTDAGALSGLTKLTVDNIVLDGNIISTLSGDLDIVTFTGGVFKFISNALQAGESAANFLEVGHGGSNAFLNRVGAGGIDFRFGGATLATFTAAGHLHLMTDTDQKHTLKIITADNLNDTGIAWENSGGAFTATIFRTDVGSNKADLVFAAGQNADIDLLIESFRIRGGAGLEGKLEIVGALKITSGSPGASKVLTSDADGDATWETPSGGGGGWVDDGIVVRLGTSTDRVGIGTALPNAPLDVTGVTPGSVGGFASGSLHVTSSSALANANAVITGHNLFGGNKQLWYLGSVSSSNDNIAFINRQNGSMGFSTNNTTRITIAADGTVGIGGSVVPSSLWTAISTSRGAIPAPRMTTTQRDAITVAAAQNGLLVYNTTSKRLDFFNGTVWGPVGAGTFGLSTVTQSFVSTTTLVDVTSLNVPLEANKKYHVQTIMYVSAGVGGLKAALNGPAGFTSLHYTVRIDEQANFNAGLHSAYDSPTGDADPEITIIEIHGTIINGGTPGTLTVRAAQESSNAVTSDILRDSFIILTEIA